MFRALIAACVAFVPWHGQNFDVASVRPHDPADTTFVVHMPTAGHFMAEGAPVKLLAMLAYGVQESQITGGPGWLATEKWDIDAKCDDERHSGEETTNMLQHLLAERFSLIIHREAQPRPVYIITVAKSGPRFKPSEKKATNIRSGAHSISLERGSIAALTGVLATAVGRPVVDHTGLKGLYDLSVVWDDAPAPDGGQEGPAGDEHGSIFTAVQEQLGLRLEASRAAVEVVVVDGVRRPTAN